ncbi:hypothetical protein TIFTF001_030533 [Ficus carica]|uniref:Protein kinase domain-containing protein n=1 Tax=Ficus carica TaxID=3494 RepID=A0AA88DXQ5_FICCA|nr:hypothetical protein TIFTF001_030533 [Ficus carica]
MSSRPTWCRVKTLGKGSVGSVFLAQLTNGNKLAVKTVELENSTSLIQEHKILEYFIITTEDDGVRYYNLLLLEYSPAGDLFDLIIKAGGRVSHESVPQNILVFPAKYGKHQWESKSGKAFHRKIMVVRLLVSTKLMPEIQECVSDIYRQGFPEKVLTKRSEEKGCRLCSCWIILLFVLLPNNTVTVVLYLMRNA